jgi:ABC-type antimicrobial peptide transport system permease subunit
MAYGVVERIHEIGLRMALGAARGDVLRLVLGRGMLLAVIGLAVGLLGSLLMSRFMESLLYGVGPIDVRTYVFVSGLLTGAAGLACYLPARRAAKVDPMVALRYE